MDLSSHKFVVRGDIDFIGGHLVKQLPHDGVNVFRTADIKARNACYQVPTGVESVTADIKQLFGRNTVYTLIQTRLGWEGSTLMKDGLRKTHDWIESQSEALACV